MTDATLTTTRTALTRSRSRRPKAVALELGTFALSGSPRLSEAERAILFNQTAQALRQ